MRNAFDMSAVMWNCLLAGKSREARPVEFNGKEVWVNDAMYGYEHCINSMLSSLRMTESQPRDAILVFEGMSSKANRILIDHKYKSGAGKPPESYEEFAKLRSILMDLWRSLGAICVTQDNAEGDDVLGWFAKNTRSDLAIHTTDNDLAVVHGTNKHGASISVYVNGFVGINKYGNFPHKYITVYKALVGDPSDKISGIPGFGQKAWETLFSRFGVEGLKLLHECGTSQSMAVLYEDAEKDSFVRRLVDGEEAFLKSWRLAQLHPEWVNSLDFPIAWLPGFVNGRSTDERLSQYGSSKRLVTADNYEAALNFLLSKMGETPEFVLDLETTTPPESDDWLQQMEDFDVKAVGVDVQASTITGCSLVFGANGQYCYYISTDHADTVNCTVEQLAAMLAALDRKKLSIAHNAAGFELPVMYKNLGKYLGNNGWRGFHPNMVDTRIAAYFWDENRFSYGLKKLSKDLLDYEQVTYDEVTGGRKMHELTGPEVLDYGCDDSYTSHGLWNFFSLVMDLEGTYQAFMDFEQKPMYLQALSYVQGLEIDRARLSTLSQADDALEVELFDVLNPALVSLGWEGTVTPVFEKLEAADIKLIVKIVLKKELKTLIRTPSKLVALVSEMEGGKALADLLAQGDLKTINELVSISYDRNPNFSAGSHKQMKELLYDVLNLPVRLRNKPTATNRANREPGSPKADDDAMSLAIKMGDVPEKYVPAIKALIKIKSITTRRGLYWKPYPHYIHWNTQKLHPSVKQSATNTRRFSSSDPNIMQMDSTRGGVRSVILPHGKRHIIVSLDESAQEVRQLADYCLDPALLSCYIGDKSELRDVHSIVGARIAGISYEEFRAKYKEEEARLNAGEAVEVVYGLIRQRAKITLFATIYGAQAAKIAQGLGISEAEAQEYINAIYAMFPGVKEWKDMTEQMASSVGYVPIHGGTIRHLAPLVASPDPSVFSKAMRQAGNARIQSAGANQIKRIMSRIWDSRLIDDYDYRWLFPLHDEGVSAVSVEDAPAVIPILHGFMTEQFLNKVPSASSIGIGRNFGELIELGEVFDPDKLQEAVSRLFPTTVREVP